MSRHRTAPEVTASRVARLKSELEQEQVPISDSKYFPDPLAASWESTYAVLCEEVTFARYVEVHEGYRPPYGCIIVDEISRLTGLIAADSLGEQPEADIEDLRLVVDGEQSFLVRDLSGASRIVAYTAVEQLDLLAAVRQVSGVCVQRLRDGRIQILMGSIVCTNDGFDWRWLLTASEMLTRIVAALALPDSALEGITDSLLEMLDLCVHLLSPRGIGATLVWRIAGEGADLGAVSNNPSLPPTDLNVFKATDRYAITSLLASVDGACFVSHEGRVLNYWAILDPSSEAKRLVSEMGGTRHTSAKRYSYDEPGSIVVVVSEDGPVTIFSDGAMIARFVDATRIDRASWVTSLELREAASVSSRTNKIECANCSKSLLIRVDTHPDIEETIQIRCPVCDSADLPSVEHVVYLEVNVAKTWDM